MTVLRGIGSDRKRERSLSGRKASICLLWVVLIVALLSLLLSIHGDSSHSSAAPPPRKHRFVDRALSFNPPSSPRDDDQNMGSTGARGDPDSTLYVDDKRIIHTGPNPLHN